LRSIASASRRTLALGALLWAGGAHAADEAIEEATPLASPTTAEATLVVPTPESAWRLRGYGLLEYAQTWLPASATPIRSAPNAEFGLSGRYAAPSGWQGFGDATGSYTRNPEEENLLLNQAGVRGGTGSWQWAVGKERSRLAPGLILSPSDFLYPQENLPGQREQRAGIWQVRASWTDSPWQSDFLWLPNMSVDAHGWPDERTRRAGAAWRGFYLARAVDVGLSAARIGQTEHAGMFVQGFFAHVTKSYVEYGRRRDAPDAAPDAGTRVLAGLSHEGIADLRLRAEYYWNGAASTPGAGPPQSRFVNGTPQFFERGRYGLLHAARTNLWHESSLSAIYARAAGADDRLGFLRYDLPLTAHQNVGIGGGRVHWTAPEQTLRRVAADWKYSF